MMDDRKKRRGPKPLPKNEKRTHTVSVRLNDDELALLNERRGKIQRGEWLRLAAFEKIPSPIPPLNATAYAELARSAANLNQLSHRVNAGSPLDIAELSAMLADFRMRLLGVQS